MFQSPLFLSRGVVRLDGDQGPQRVMGPLCENEGKCKTQSAFMALSAASSRTSGNTLQQLRGEQVKPIPFSKYLSLF